MIARVKKHIINRFLWAGDHRSPLRYHHKVYDKSNLRRICFCGVFFVKRRKKLNFRKKKDEKNLKKGVAFREKGAIIRNVRSV